MNDVQRKVIENAIGNDEDNLARAEMQKRVNPNWVSGNGETIDEVIAQYKWRIETLKNGF